MIEHRLSFEVEVVKCRCGENIALNSTDRGWCFCGWKVWAQTRTEMEHLHKAHVEYVTTTAETQPEVSPQQQQSTNRHRLRWNETSQSLTGYCGWCNWRLSGLPRHEIEQAFLSHLTSVS